MEKKKIKVTQVSRFAPPHIGGIETLVGQICDSLPPEDFEQEVICCSNTENKSVENGVEYKRCKYLFDIASNSISPKFIFELSNVDTDILHYHMPFIFAVIAHFIARPKYKKMLVTYHGDILKYAFIMNFFNKIYDKFLALADKIHIHVLTPESIENFRGLKKYKDKCVSVLHGINILDENAEEHFTKDKGKYNDRKIILSVGRLIHYKGFEFALKAMKQVDENSILLIIGEGPLRNNLERIISTDHLENKVELLGRVSDEELQKYYEMCDIYLFPSSSRGEAFGVVQLEAMRCGKPVINTNVGTGVNYVSIHNETGLTVEPKNPEQLAKAINLLLSDDELRLKLGQNARKRVEKIFDIEKIKIDYQNLYKRIYEDAKK